MTSKTIDDKYNHINIENKCRKLWDDLEIYKFDKDSKKPIFSVDTPPPYVSASHLHVGHAMSYSQAEFIVRYQRMLGKNIFYPMGFDDNGLPTERYIEQKYKINKSKTTRSEFRKLCLEETSKGAKVYKNLWKSLGLSVDWNLSYSTIDSRCQRIAQESFIDLYEKGLIYRSSDPVLWDTKFESSLAQTDIETITRKSKLYDIKFGEINGQALIISTTRPELLPACVALYCNPKDERYSKLINSTLKVPIFEYTIKINSSIEVDPDFGTGLMMVCTFGDGEDVKKWKEDSLETRICISSDGKMGELSGKYQGMTVENARSAIIEDLKNRELIVKHTSIKQNLSVSERTGQPVEFMLAPQWFIKIMDFKEQLLERSRELNWHPKFMKVRLDSWIEGLKYDWNISRQRFYGVPIPVWYDKDGNTFLPSRKSLPIDPLESLFPEVHPDKENLIGESDVMDTWMISSLTPLINCNWSSKASSIDKIYPMTVRVQAFEIIRTWLFYTLYKSEVHTDSLPWENVMISGWGLNEQGKKISKRDLESFTDESGYNRYVPDSVINKYGADALRYWAAGSQLGHDLKFSEKDVKAGQKLVLKLWNAARFCSKQFFNYDFKTEEIPIESRTLEDRWILFKLNIVVKDCTKYFDSYDYARARESLSKFFWQSYCDTYLELVKDRFRRPELYNLKIINSAKITLYETLRIIIGLFAPFIPFVTEELFQCLYKRHESYKSLHISSWQKEIEVTNQDLDELNLILEILKVVRNLRTKSKISQSSPIKRLILDCSNLSEIDRELIKKLEKNLIGACYAEKVVYEKADERCDSYKLAIGIGI